MESETYEIMNSEHDESVRVHLEFAPDGISLATAGAAIAPIIVTTN